MKWQNADDGKVFIHAWIFIVKGWLTDEKLQGPAAQTRFFNTAYSQIYEKDLKEI